METTKAAIAKRILIAAGTLALLFGAGAGAQQSADSLQSGFENPPSSARPRVWWHWMNGNITQEGIKLDLEWMHRIGLAGFQNFDAALNTPQVVDDGEPVTAECPRCGTSLHVRKPASIAKTWAYIVSAFILYIPANVFPITDTRTLFDDQSDTIFSGESATGTGSFPNHAVSGWSTSPRNRTKSRAST